MLTAAQQAIRATGIGASETAMILNESPHGGPIDLLLRKWGMSSEKETPAQQMGNYLEDGVARWYADTTKSIVRPVVDANGDATTLRSSTHPWVLATPDRWVDVGGRRKTLQIKMVGQWMAHHWKDDEDGIPDYVRIQVTQEMHVAEVDCCDVAAVIAGTEPHIYQVTYDHTFALALVDVVTDFWHRFVLPKRMPELDGSESATEMLKRLYPRPTKPTLLDATPEADGWVRTLRKARLDLAAASTLEERARQELKRIIGDAPGMRGADWSATWKATKAGTRPFLFTDETIEKKGKAA